MQSAAYKENFALIDWSGLKPDKPKERVQVARSSLPFPMLMRDEMNPTEHPFDGREYTSKSAFRKVTKAGGGEEIGNDPARFRSKPRPKADKKELRETIKRADYMVRNGIPANA